MIGFIPEMHLKRISITTSNYLKRLFVFAVQQCREIWIGDTPG